ncbi:D-xylose transport system ATP-binding protein [Bacillus thermophilus]|uniref:D-xylose transport system ATP-binding protein n=1 Tax=Siminovitchia thermophila TaxID=1245522 RepID=A0ABS2R8Y2_9BACI|nr:xylose ABC transporter ATP-binding protein [Siminovitchia thermophila]MBM7716106.1 D-xylose transport system ATP-binding protein [Siminovitchia thermophila]ONK23032.1 xylose ABC transporter ATP-binding protein [Bacillus sp. VT-16-64]
MSAYILEMVNIHKSFPGVKALDNINMKVKKGEIHSLCGENGAGKSTLIKILSGVYPSGQFEGKIKINGEVKEFHNIRDAEMNGIVCIHQELALVPELSIQENIFLGNEPHYFGVVHQSDMYNRTKKLLNDLGLNISPNEKVKNLGIGHQQLVEIAKALSKNAKILILDEPTSALTEKESEVLLNILKKLKSQGVTSIYISHKLDEVLAISDSVSAIRDGQFIGTRSIGNINKDDLIYMMVGRKLEKLYPRKKRISQECRFEVKNLTVYDTENPSRKVVNNINFKAYKGEILGIAGLMGAGRTEMATSIFGVYPGKSSGEVYVDGQKRRIRHAADAIEQGIALVSEDRKSSGLVLEMTVKENISLASLDRGSRLVLDHDKEITAATQYVKELNVKTPSVHSIVNHLSGGNQQKVVLGKWLLTNPKVLILDEPTRGIDIGAKFEIYQIMNKLVDQGVIVIMISSELEEVLGISDRVLVISEGELRADLKIEEATQEKILYYATGGS